jgi:hypothetical protein
VMFIIQDKKKNTRKFYNIFLMVIRNFI